MYIYFRGPGSADHVTQLQALKPLSSAQPTPESSDHELPKFRHVCNLKKFKLFIVTVIVNVNVAVAVSVIVIVAIDIVIAIGIVMVIVLSFKS